MSSEERDFAVVPINPLLAAVNVAGAIALVVVAILLLPAGSQYALRDLWWLVIAVLLLLMVTCLPFARRRVTLQGRQLRIAAAIHTLRVPVEDLDLDHARIVDLTASDDDRPGMKTFGSKLPGYQAGHFKQLRGPKAFVLITDRHRVLLLPEHSGRRLLLSLEEPQRLLEALRRAAGEQRP